MCDFSVMKRYYIIKSKHDDFGLFKVLCLDDPIDHFLFSYRFLYVFHREFMSLFGHYTTFWSDSSLCRWLEDRLWCQSLRDDVWKIFNSTSLLFRLCGWRADIHFAMVMSGLDKDWYFLLWRESFVYKAGCIRSLYFLYWLSFEILVHWLADGVALFGKGFMSFRSFDDCIMLMSVFY